VNNDNDNTAQYCGEILDELKKGSLRSTLMRDDLIWISVDDRLPTKSGTYRVKAVVGSARPRESVGYIKGIMRGTGFSFSTGDWQKITHWLGEE